jgi:hypothetical protein
LLRNFGLKVGIVGVVGFEQRIHDLASWPLATEAEAIIADKASSPLLRALDGEPTPEPTPEPEQTPAPATEPEVTHVDDYRSPVPDIEAAKRERKTIAQRLRRAAARAAQWPAAAAE